VPDIQRVLVIDDQVDIGNFVAAAAKSIGLTCTVTTDAAGFLKELTPDIAVILMDLVMPSMDGIELLRLLAERECRVPIVLMSGVGSRVLETAEQLALSLGINIIGHLDKPFRLKELQNMLRSTTETRSSPLAKPRSQSAVQDEELFHAIDQDEFILHYQPQIEIATSRVTGVEALVRWKHPERGMIYPDHFIGRAEALGVIDRIGWIVYERGMSEVAEFADEKGDIPTLSLNVSFRSLHDLLFPDKFLSIIGEYGLSPERVTVEITESGLLDQSSRTLDVLARLRLKDVALSIDDFGTGYAMMQQLRNVPATELKIDKSFVQKIESSKRDRIIVQKTIEIGHELGMKVIGEGVETQAQLDFLRDNNCDGSQGYLFSRALSAGDLKAWLKDYRSR
jgi:EAL domain-containing protein (putative c-di-GMP-specific phosphodiesterase class I)/CheY-like chemotaxis protein